jgi:hypothetical protein
MTVVPPPQRLKSALGDYTEQMAALYARADDPGAVVIVAFHQRPGDEFVLGLFALLAGDDWKTFASGEVLIRTAPRKRAEEFFRAYGVPGHGTLRLPAHRAGHITVVAFGWRTLIVTQLPVSATLTAAEESPRP